MSLYCGHKNDDDGLGRLTRLISGDIMLRSLRYRTCTNTRIGIIFAEGRAPYSVHAAITSEMKLIDICTSVRRSKPRDTLCMTQKHKFVTAFQFPVFAAPLYLFSLLTPFHRKLISDSLY